MRRGVCGDSPARGELLELLVHGGAVAEELPVLPIQLRGLGRQARITDVHEAKPAVHGAAVLVGPTPDDRPVSLGIVVEDQQIGTPHGEIFRERAGQSIDRTVPIVVGLRQMTLVIGQDALDVVGMAGHPDDHHTLGLDRRGVGIGARLRLLGARLGLRRHRRGRAGRGRRPAGTSVLRLRGHGRISYKYGMGLAQGLWV